MNDSKPGFLLTLLAAGLVATWVYHLYDKTVYTAKTKEIIVRDSAAIADAVNDSIRRFYAAATRGLDKRFDSSQTGLQRFQGQVELGLKEIYRLKKEIMALLDKRNISDEELFFVKDKIKTLQTRIEDLKQRNDSLQNRQHGISDSLASLTESIKFLGQNLSLADSTKKSSRGW